MMRAIGAAMVAASAAWGSWRIRGWPSVTLIAVSLVAGLLAFVWADIWWTARTAELIENER